VKDDPVIRLFLQTAQAIEERLEAALNPVELSVAKYSALKQLALADEPLSLSEMAARLVCVRSNISQLVDRLEGDGLVRRVEDPRDRRCVRADLTGLGRERQAAGARQMETVRGEIVEILSEIDRGALERALARLRRASHPGGMTGDPQTAKLSRPPSH
jgi:DNA-binding MarR family transcriptional regulator